jgi:nitrogen fixation/metabolism regulation signal transduction histidine kinase
MRKIYFFLSIIGLIATIFSLVTVSSVTEFNDTLIIALQVLLLVICILGIVINYDSVYSKLKKWGLFRVRRA